MEIYEVMLDSKQYAQLKSMLIEDRKGDLIRKIPINGNDLFCDRPLQTVGVRAKLC